MDKRLLDILCCPVSKRPLRPLTATEREQLNAAIRGGTLDTVAGEKVAEPIAEGLITTDGQLVYRVEDGIPVMLPEAGIGTVQLGGFTPETDRA
ncbi:MULTISPECIES: Trm112 family protein [unclassified Luteibacter]|uniref:Trm112 family protein n=1 Tax=unclassified Luteibacter TaxID=2620188 RepID=UPI0008B9B3E9|nr:MULTISPECIES: Trm112 family protein [unclassified Luteibacter]MDR6934929.1 uncharacterized protein YbaR (Trm112 family) [Luteibacter sp. 3190]SEO83949.1 Uncharacterized conserved protein YbaR, Trm112 family [Luteibacter sp. UNC138MFCol5.1]SEW01328.1 Uncharacterized conserved protein YbaR, Trm112 family [Luteibacter sp. 329MFSha]